MKITLYTFIFALLAQFGQAQTTETVSIGAGYTNEVYYNLESGDETSASRAEWDIAFNVTYLGSSILSNGGNGVEVFQYPNGNYTDWNDMDLSDLDTWEVQHNSDSTWVRGAFDHGAEGFNIGWGLYNPVTHVVTGELLYVLRFPDEQYKKIWFVDLTDEIYTYKYADLDGSNEVEGTIVKADYTDKNFAFLSLQNDETLDREPANNDWDLLFTKYVTDVGIYYSVTGVLSNIGVEVLQVDDTPTDDADYTGETFNTKISEIGYDWKEFTTEFVIAEDRTYFVQAVNGNIWKVIFTGFGGSANGDFIFTKELVGVVGIEEISSITELGMFPNPSNGLVNIVYHTIDSQPMQAIIYDVTGKIVVSSTLSSNVGLNQTTMELSHLNKGVYIVELGNSSEKIHTRLIIE